MTEGVETLEPWNFNVSYDKLVIASGAHALTFGIKGVNEHATFLREVHHAQEIRRKLLLNLMLSDVPGICCFRYNVKFHVWSLNFPCYNSKLIPTIQTMCEVLKKIQMIRTYICKLASCGK